MLSNRTIVIPWEMLRCLHFMVCSNQKKKKEKICYAFPWWMLSRFLVNVFFFLISTNFIESSNKKYIISRAVPGIQPRPIHEHTPSTNAIKKDQAETITGKREGQAKANTDKQEAKENPERNSWAGLMILQERPQSWHNASSIFLGWLHHSLITQIASHVSLAWPGPCSEKFDGSSPSIGYNWGCQKIIS